MPGGTQRPGRPPLRRVAIVESHALIRATLVDLFNLEMDLRVVAECAEAGPAAVAAIEAAEADIVVIDPALPDGSGVETVRQILDFRPATRVVLLTAATFGRSVDDALAAGAHACVSKSWPFRTILDTIRSSGEPAPG